MFKTFVSAAALFALCTALSFGAQGQVIRSPGTKP